MKTQTDTIPLVDKLLAKKGPVEFSEEELKQIQAAFLGVNQRCLELTQMVHHIGEALRWNNLQVTHTKRDDGSVGFDLKNAPNTEHVTVN